mmetsp:Transcript_34789/g.103772  ORF Transcript_34789/g.103772 Transcript_34789/m.103772 type:complete len:130 (-) Transcript_34789:585-974(-)
MWVKILIAKHPPSAVAVDTNGSIPLIAMMRVSRRNILPTLLHVIESYVVASPQSVQVERQDGGANRFLKGEQNYRLPIHYMTRLLVRDNSNKTPLTDAKKDLHWNSTCADTKAIMGNIIWGIFICGRMV